MCPVARPNPKPGPRVACPRWTGAWPRGLCTPRWALVQLVQRSVGLYRLYRLYRLSSARYGARLYSAPSDGFTTIPVRRLHNHPCPTVSQPSLSDGFTTIPVRRSTLTASCTYARQLAHAPRLRAAPMGSACRCRSLHTPRPRGRGAPPSRTMPASGAARGSD